MTTLENRGQYLTAGSLIGDHVKDRNGRELGRILDIMLDTTTGAVAYVVVAVGGFLHIGEKLFTFTWNELHLHPEDQCFSIDIDKETLKEHKGIDPNHWPLTNPRPAADTYEYLHE